MYHHAFLQQSFDTKKSKAKLKKQNHAFVIWEINTKCNI